jgi:hypothetical protein
MSHTTFTTASLLSIAPVGLSLMVVAGLSCSLGPPRERVTLTFVNSTELELCNYGSLASVARSEICAEIKPRDRTVWRPSCGPRDTDRFPMTVVISIASRGDVIYERTATCGEWRAARATFIIKQVDGQFVVTDSLPGD